MVPVTGMLSAVARGLRKVKEVVQGTTKEILDRLDKNVTRLEKRFDELDKELRDLTKAVYEMQGDLKAMKADISSIKDITKSTAGKLDAFADKMDDKFSALDKKMVEQEVRTRSEIKNEIREAAENSRKQSDSVAADLKEIRADLFRSPRP